MMPIQDSGSGSSKMFNGDFHFGTDVNSALNLFNCIITDMGYSFYQVPVGKDEVTNEEMALMIEDLMLPDGVLPILAHLAEEKSIILTGRRIFSFDYVYNPDALLGYELVDNDETKEYMEMNEFQRITNALVYNLSSQSLYKIFQPKPDRKLEILHQIPRFKLPQKDPVSGAEISHFHGVDFSIAGDFDRICRHESHNEWMLKFRAQGKEIKLDAARKRDHEIEKALGDEELDSVNLNNEENDINMNGQVENNGEFREG